MNRAEFLKRLTIMYPNSFSQNNLQIWMARYKEILSEKIDFDMLYKIMTREYLYIDKAPAPAWFAQYLSLVTPKPKPVIEKPIQQSPEELEEIKEIQKKINEDLQKIKDKSSIFTEK